MQLVDICYILLYILHIYIYNMVQRRGVIQKIGLTQPTGSVSQWVSSHHVFCHLHSGYQIQHILAYLRLAMIYDSQSEIVYVIYPLVL